MSMSTHESMGEEGGDTDVMSAAATLRTDLNYLLGEHLILAAKATGAALEARPTSSRPTAAC